jgi:Glycosyl transferase family 2.
VNNRSTQPETFDYLNEVGNLDSVEVVEYDKEFNFAQLHNDIISQIKTPYTCMLNSDVEIIYPDWLTQAVGVAEDPGVGLVGGNYCSVITAFSTLAY